MAAQALALSSAPLIVLTGGLAGARLHPDPAFATLPVAAMIIGMASAVWPVARLANLLGRRRVFTGSMLLGVLAALLAALSLYSESFSGFVISTLLLGATGAAVQQFRFLAMEKVAVEERANVASKLLLAGLVSAFLGPELSRLSDLLPGLPDLVLPFIGLSVCMLVAGGILWWVIPLGRHLTTSELESGGRSWPELLQQPSLWLAMGSATIGYMVMAYVMTATPLSMTGVAQLDLAQARWVIQSHIVAMFLPSLFTGRLISRFGFHLIILLGLVFMLATQVMALAGILLLHYWVSLVLLGIGWNFLFVSGTALLGQCYQHAEAGRVQGLNDSLVFGSQAVASLGSGLMLLTVGWNGVILSTLPALGLLAVILLWNRMRLQP